MKDCLTPKLLDLLSVNLGLRIREQEQKLLQTKIAERIKALGLSSPDAYHHLLTSTISPKLRQAEWQELARLLTITESYFFRDQGQFSLLREQILPEIIQHKQLAFNADSACPSAFYSVDYPLCLPKRSLKVWSAGCSTGEEAYSLAILLKELIPNIQDWTVVVLGTDINSSALEQAKRGIYSDWSFRLVDPALRRAYFRQHRDGWEIDPYVREMVTLRLKNLVQDDGLDADFRDFDLILCRNVFIYFNTEAIAQTLNTFHQALAPHGYLMTGHAELYGQGTEQFRVRSFPQSVLYQRCSTVVDQLDYSSLIATQATTALVQQTTPQFSSQLSVAMPLVSMPVQPIKPAKPQLTPSHQSETPAETGLKPTLDRLFNEINTLIATKAYKDAIHKAKQLLMLDPSHLQVHCLMAESYANLGDYFNAHLSCQQAIQLDALAIDPYYLLAQVAEEQGNIDDAKRYLKRIIYLMPTSIYAYLELGLLHERDGNHDRAERIWRSALTILETTPQACGYKQLTTAELKLCIERRLNRIAN